MKTKTLVPSAVLFNALGFVILLAGLIIYMGQANTSTALAQVNIASEPITSDAQSEEFVYLFDEMTNRMMRVNLLDGSQQAIELGIEGETAGINGGVVSKNGRLVAFCVLVSMDADQSRFVVRDINSGQNLFEHDLDGLCYAGAFSPDDSRIAIGLGMMSTPSNWSVQIYDVNTGAIFQEQGADALSDGDVGANASIMPSVIAFDNESLYFKGIPMAPDQDYMAYHWDLATNTVNFAEKLSHPGSALFVPTGEIAYPATMSDIESRELYLNDANVDRVVYRDTDLTVGMSMFVNGGQQLLILLTNGTAYMSESTPLINQYVILNRDGTTEVLNQDGLHNLVSTSTGFVTMRLENSPQGTIQQLIRYEDGVITVIWETAPSASGFWTIWGAISPTIPQNLSPFVAVN